MRTGFALPSCTYNIVLSVEDAQQLKDYGVVCFRPARIDGRFIDEYGKALNTRGHTMAYEDAYGKQPVQFVTISVCRTEEENVNKGTNGQITKL